ncbi:hypothetical protein [Streptomyces atroolivaceus]
MVLELPAGRREQRLAQLIQMLHTLVTLWKMAALSASPPGA